MPFVLDASIAACWLIDDEDNAAATVARGLILNDHAVVPALWWFEIRNTLISNERRGRLTQEDTNAALRLPAGLAITIDRLPDEASVLGLARRHRLTAYDAAYLDVAHRHGCPLATLDRALIRAARAEGVALLGPPPDLR